MNAIRARRRRIVVAGGVRLQSYLLSLSPILLMDGTLNGSNVANLGSGGTALDGVPTAVTIDATGMTFNGTTSVITIPNHASINAMSTQRWAFLINAATLGESSAGSPFSWLDGVGGSRTACRFQSTNRLQANVRTDATDAACITNDNQVDFIGSLAWLFIDYDDADALGLGRRIRLMRGLSGAIATLTLATDTAATGTVETTTGSLYIGNRNTSDLTFNGLMKQVFASTGLWTTAIMQELIDLAGV